MQSSIQIEETAAGWLARRDSGEWEAVDEADLIAWLDASIAHRVAYVRLDAAWQVAGRLGELGSAAGTKK